MVWCVLSQIAWPGNESISHGVIHLDSTLLSQPLALSGNWRFVADRWLTPTQLRELAQTETPPAIMQSVPGVWDTRVGAPTWWLRGQGIGTYWLTIDSSATPALHHIPLALLISRTCSAARVWLVPDDGDAGTLIGQIGRPDHSANLELANSDGRLLPLTLSSAPRHHLLFHISNFGYRNGGLCGSVALGTLEQVTAASHRQAGKETAIATMLALVGFYSALVYARQRQHLAPLWLALSCAAFTVFYVATSGLFGLLFSGVAPWHFELRHKLEYLAMSWAPLALIQFYRHSFDSGPKTQTLAVLAAIASLCSVLIVVTPTVIFSRAFLAFAAVAGVQVLVALQVLTAAVKERRSHAVWILIGMLPLLFIAPYDIYHRYFSTGAEMLIPYALVFLVFVHTQISSSNFAEAFQLADRLSKHLQDEVQLQTATLQSRNRQLELAREALQAANDALKKLSITDGLTKVYNRMHFEHEFHKEWRRCSRQQLPISILLVDVDFFKKINDSAGHLAGDVCLQAMAEELRKHFKRAGELVARYGGEEFVVMLPDTNEQIAIAAAERLRLAIAALTIRHGEFTLRMTISIGISTTTPGQPPQRADALLEAADTALYDAKHQGRNRVRSLPLTPDDFAERQQRLL